MGKKMCVTLVWSLGNIYASLFDMLGAGPWSVLMSLYTPDLLSEPNVLKWVDSYSHDAPKETLGLLCINTET